VIWMAIEAFKKYKRESRVQVSEENYSKGMQYTNAPITEGFSRLLVNYDIKDNGEIVMPRPGLVVKELMTVSEVIADIDQLFIIDSKECTEDDQTRYQQIIVGDKVTKQLWVFTKLPKTSPEAFDSSALSYKLTESARYKDTTAPNVHGLVPISSAWAGMHIGTFAFNNSYYYFDDDGLHHTRFIDDRYKSEAVTPRVLSPKEAVMWGYNMLRPNPYNFSNTLESFEIPLILEGVLPYDADGQLIMTPQVNQSLYFECFFKGYAGKTYEVKWEWKEPGSPLWTTLKTETITLAEDSRFLCDFSAPNSTVMLKITATNTADDIDVQVLTIGFDFGKGTQRSGANAQQVVYDLKQATAMAFWKNRLVLARDNMLFLSEVNDPSYFPYPNNMEPFQETIMHIIPSLDNLLVFTTTQLHTLTLSEDGLSWTVKTIQSNLNIAPWDIPLIRTVKNMVFFKSGNYYYMVVPRANSTTGELVVAPISRPVELFFDRFKEAIDSVLKKVYDYEDDIQLVHHYNFLDFEDVHNMYVFQTTKGVLLNIAVLYNTVARTWRLYLSESQHLLQPYKQDATTKGTFASIVDINSKPCIQFLRYDATDCVDRYIAKDQAEHELFFKNFQMLDTGYREIGTNLKKRFREGQLKLNNRSNRSLGFHTEFFIDGDRRKTFYKYKLHHEIDPENPNYGLITMERELVDPEILPGTTILAETEQDYDFWQLDVSPFPELSMWKIRIPFTGKGYAPRMVLVSYNQESYELLNQAWVFRQLYSR